MSEKTLIPLSVPVIKGNEWQYVKDCLDTGWVSSAGKYVNLFEERMAAYIGSKYAIACINGTAALHISLLLAGVGSGDEVIVPTVTFIAPINAVKYVGAEPVFMDCDAYLNMDPEKVAEFIKRECVYRRGELINKKSKRRVKALIPVHVFGNPVNLEPLVGLAKKYKLAIIEDATESLGSYYTAGRLAGKRTGAVGVLGCFSFNGNKIITTGGGGMIVTNDGKLAAKARYLTTQAKDDEVKYVHHEVGYNYRLSNIPAALGVAQLEKIVEYIKTKRANYDRYRQSLKGVNGLVLIQEPDYGSSNYWFYSLLVEKRSYGRSNLELMGSLAAGNVQARPLWRPNHLQRPYRKNQAYRIENAVRYYGQLLNLPCSVDLGKEDIKRVVKVIRENGKK